MSPLFYQLLRFSYTVQTALTRHFTPMGLWLGLGAILLFLLGGDSNRSLTYQIFAFVIALLLIAIALSVGFPYRFRATRSLPRFGTVGVPLKYRVSLQLTSRRRQTDLRLLEVLADPRPSLQALRSTPEPWEAHRSPLSRQLGIYRWLWFLRHNQGVRIAPVDVPLLSPQRTTEVVVELLPQRRGIVRFESLILARPDPLGLFQACRAIALPQSLLILPQLYVLPAIALPGLRRYQSGGVALASSVGDSEEFRSLRDYRPGDSPRKIHWKSWAKIGKPIVKEEQDEFFVRHALILDTFQSAPYSEQFEAAVAVAASFACEVQTQESLLDLMFVGLEAYCFTIGRGLSHTDHMLEILASVRPCQDHSFDQVLPLVISRMELLSGCICVFLTWDEQRQALVRLLQARQLPTLVLVLTADTLDPPLPVAEIADPLTQVATLRLNHLQEDLMQL